MKAYSNDDLRKGDVVIMDNMSSHKVAGVIELIKLVGAEIKYLRSQGKKEKRNWKNS